MADISTQKNDLGIREPHTELRNSRYGRRDDFLADLTNTIKDNPLPAALVGMGILWMFAGGGKTSVGEVMTGRGTRSMVGSFARSAERAGESVLHGAGKIGSSVVQAAQDSVDTMTEAAGQVGRALTPSSGDEAARERRTSGRGLSDRGERYGDQADITDTPTSLQSGFQQSLFEFFEQRPLVLGAAGLALGAGIAASLPVSEAEQQLLGKASDRLLNKVSDVTDQAKKITAAAVEEVEAQGTKTRPNRAGQNGNARKPLTSTD